MDSRTRKIGVRASKGNMDYEKRVYGTYTDINIVITHINDMPLGESPLTINARSESCESTLDYVTWPSFENEGRHFIEPSLEARIIISCEKKHLWLHTNSALKQSTTLTDITLERQWSWPILMESYEQLNFAFSRKR